MESFHATTIVSVRRHGKVVIGGDGQVTLGNTVMKSNARKLRRLGKGDVLAGFAGATADAFTLFELFEQKLERFSGNLVEPENGLIAIGSGGPYAQAAAKALIENTELDARRIVEQALKIAGDICIYTNDNISIEEL